MASLYDINARLATYEMEIDPETGEWLNSDELDALKLEKEEKRENIALYIKNIEAEASAIKAEMQNFDDRYKRLMRKAEKLREYLASDLNGEEFKTTRVEIKFRKSESVEILNEDAIPERFLDIRVERKPQKSEIKKFLKNTDEEIPWAKLNVKQNLQLK